MFKQHKHDLIVILGVLAAGVSLYLAIGHYIGYTVPCTVTHGCEVVLTSKYATLFGLPLSVWGVIFYFGVIGSALMANHYAAWQKLLTVLLSIGALGALIFISIQIFILHKICQYCLTVDLTTLFLFLWNLNVERTKPGYFVP